MKTLPTEFLNGIQNEVTSIATLWKLTLQNGTVFHFTNHDKDLVVGGDTYTAATGFSPSSIENKNSLGVDNLDIVGILSSDSITESDLLSGLYDYADIEIFLINFLSSSLVDAKFLFKKGRLGEVSIKRNSFVSEVRGMTDLLQKEIGQIFTPNCRAKLGDAKCGFDLNTATWSNGSQTGPNAKQTLKTVSRLIDSRSFICSTSADSYGFHTGGIIQWTSGDNSGTTFDIKEYGADGLITIALQPLKPIKVGDVFTLITGCDKTTTTCYSKFNNILNFRGEPYVPGIDKILETATTRSSDE